MRFYGCYPQKSSNFTDIIRKKASYGGGSLKSVWDLQNDTNLGSDVQKMVDPAGFEPATSAV